MKILVSGGGTGGHITPILAVAHELKRQEPNCHIVYVGEKDGKFSALTQGQADITETYNVSAGKFRRYHGERWFKRLFDIRTNWLNLRDAYRIVIGSFQALRLVRKLKPDVIFLKGGFVGVPVGFAAIICKVPFLTHDSDAVPGLANRLVSRWARLHTTGMPSEFYSYPKEKTRYVGVLVSEAYKSVTPTLQRSYRQSLGLPEKGRVLLVTGGSLGAQKLNQAVAKVVPKLLSTFPDLQIIHQVGKGNLNIYSQPLPANLTVLEFMNGMERYTGAADLVVTRAGANTLAELGVQGKASIVVPNPFLTGGHQLQNAQYFAEHQAVKVVKEQELDGNKFEKNISELLEYPEMREKLAKNFQSITKTGAATELARLIIELGNKHL